MAATMQRQNRNIIRDEQGGTFRVLVGIHFGDGPTGCQCDDCVLSNGKNHVYRARNDRRIGNQDADPPGYSGDIIVSKQDLCRRFNQEPFSRKFERVFDAAPATPIGSVEREWGNLDTMSVKDLQDLAAAEEIDTKGAKTKEDLIKAIRGK